MNNNKQYSKRAMQIPIRGCVFFTISRNRTDVPPLCPSGLSIKEGRIIISHCATEKGIARPSN